MDAARERWCFELNGDQGRKGAQICRSGGACQRGQPVSFERCTLDFQERRDIQGHKNDVDVGGGERRRKGRAGRGRDGLRWKERNTASCTGIGRLGISERAQHASSSSQTCLLRSTCLLHQVLVPRCLLILLISFGLRASFHPTPELCAIGGRGAPAPRGGEGSGWIFWMQVLYIYIYTFC